MVKHRNIFILCALFILTLTLSGCKLTETAPAETEAVPIEAASVAGSTTPAVVAPSQTEPSEEARELEKYIELMRAYEAMMVYRDTWEGLVGDLPVAPDAQYAKQIGFAHIDLNSDGQKEFLAMDASPLEDAGIILGLYTVEDNVITPIYLQNVGTASLHLCEGNLLCMRVSGTDFFQITYGRFSGASDENGQFIVPIESLNDEEEAERIDGHYVRVNPDWILTTSNPKEYDAYTDFMNETAKARNKDNQPVAITDLLSSFDGVSYTYKDLNYDGIDELIIKPSETFLQFFTWNPADGSVVLLTQPFYSGCDRIEFTSGGFLMTDTTHPGRECFIYATYDGGAGLMSKMRMFHEYNDPLYPVEQEIWFYDEDGLMVEKTKEEFESDLQSLQYLVYEPRWLPLPVNMQVSSGSPPQTHTQGSGGDS